MTRSTTYDETGAPTELKYVKTGSCTSNCTWYDDKVQISDQQQWLAEQNTLGTRSYSYDTAGRLTQVQDTPTGQGCSTRQYAYDPDSNRASQTTIPPASGGACASTGATPTTHTYDAADRITDPGITYDDYGRIKTLPAQDAGASTLTSNYYVTDRLHTQTQSGQTITNNLDPTDRTRERISSGTTSTDEIDHYTDSGDSPAWVSTAATWDRYITGIDGNLAADQTATTLTIKLSNLHGDIIGTAGLNDPQPTLTQDTDEFGNPYPGKTTTKYDWLGTKLRTTALPTGIIDMGAREYVPAIGRFEQVDPVSHPNDPTQSNPYVYAGSDPVARADPSGLDYFFWFTLRGARGFGGDLRLLGEGGKAPIPIGGPLVTLARLFLAETLITMGNELAKCGDRLQKRKHVYSCEIQIGTIQPLGLFDTCIPYGYWRINYDRRRPRSGGCPFNGV